MKKIILLVIMALLATSRAVAWDNNYETSRQKQEKERNKKYPYESTTGTRYKYDLSKPSDRIKYEVDPAAQVRDSVNPRVGIDRSLGQHGGGSE